MVQTTTLKIVTPARQTDALSCCLATGDEEKPFCPQMSLRTRHKEMSQGSNPDSNHYMYDYQPSLYHTPCTCKGEKKLSQQNLIRLGAVPLFLGSITSCCSGKSACTPSPSRGGRKARREKVAEIEPTLFPSFV